jgi:O-antigen/teichoic acid export membrane protein
VYFFLGTIVASGLNFLFQAIMSRMLGPNIYGALGSLLGLITVVTLVASALQASVTHSVASGEHLSGDGSNGMVLGRPMIRLAIAALACLIVASAASPLLERYLHLRSIAPVVLFGLFLALNVLCIVPQGVLLGRIRFTTVAVGLISNAFTRCVFGVALVKLHFGLDGAMAAAVLGAIAQLGVMAFPLREEMMKVGTRRHKLVKFRSVLLAAVSLGGVSAFIGIDSILARHFLPRIESGYYVSAATGARIALFLPAAITSMAFARISRTVGDKTRTRRLLLTNLFIVSLLGVGVAVGIILFSHLIIAILFGSKFRAASGTIRILAFSAAEMGVLSLLTYFCLAHKSLLANISWIGVAGVSLLIWAYHKDPSEIAWVMLGATSVVLVLQAFAAWWLA